MEATSNRVNIQKPIFSAVQKKLKNIVFNCTEKIEVLRYKFYKICAESVCGNLKYTDESQRFNK